MAVINFQIQVSVVVRRPKWVRVTRELLLQFLYYRAATGEDPPGVQIRAIHWEKQRGLGRKKEYDYDLDKDITECVQKMLGFGTDRISFEVKEV